MTRGKWRPGMQSPYFFVGLGLRPRRDIHRSFLSLLLQPYVQQQGGTMTGLAGRSTTGKNGTPAETA